MIYQTYIHLYIFWGTNVCWDSIGIPIFELLSIYLNSSCNGVSRLSLYYLINNLNCYAILDFNLVLPPWLCQPLIRVLPQSNIDGIKTDQEGNKLKTDEKEVRNFNMIQKQLCILHLKFFLIK